MPGDRNSMAYSRGEFLFSGPQAIFNWGPSGRFAMTGVIRISTTSARYIHWTSCSNSWTYCLILNYPDIISGTTCAANELRGTFDQCSPAVKNTVFRHYCMPRYVCQLWSKYTQTSMKRLRAAYNNDYRIMHYIAYAEMLVFAHTKLAIMSGHLMRCWETTRNDFLYDAHLHPTFLFDRL